MAEKKESSRQTKIGVVTSDKMDKTVVVNVELKFFHRTYSKVVKRTSKFKAHDEKNECGIGDKVLIMETRPLSRGKRWTVKKIIEKAK
ncbi:MAG TPA: 30S ribosomal protein S17 [Acidobacteriota bacterium]|jgi:small subunit ribosomal protein S17|nr:30S ribosomal protein S17 [Acidobacteriota bacterium]HNT16473.1 30S ribosomal protein S17 [Acidobacteriota bacterium]HPA27277.1 30S ribosomal protein S17 [Acidobacteriota bacterium]HQO20555.1 30S ribosomal protein S17 [Acidobacteriota bacterium]HQQ47059.1 30S ribosomal protein S17 [Acidobacteriota bacterium]